MHLSALTNTYHEYETISSTRRALQLSWQNVTLDRVRPNSNDKGIPVSLSTLYLINDLQFLLLHPTMYTSAVCH